TPVGLGAPASCVDRAPARSRFLSGSAAPEIPVGTCPHAEPSRLAPRPAGDDNGPRVHPGAPPSPPTAAARYGRQTYFGSSTPGNWPPRRQATGAVAAPPAPAPVSNVPPRSVFRPCSAVPCTTKPRLQLPE